MVLGNALVTELDSDGKGGPFGFLVEHDSKDRGVDFILKVKEICISLI